MAEVPEIREHRTESERADALAQPHTEGWAIRRLSLSAEDAPELMRDWLRELLFWHETEGLAFAGARFETLAETQLEAEVTLRPARDEPVREIKGVTLHGLAAERRAGTWVARVILDV